MIDWDRVNELKEEVGPEDFLEVAELFLEEVDGVIARLKTSSDKSLLEEDMHFLKGSALNLGFSHMGKICQLGEKSAANGRLAEFDLQELFKTYENSKQEFVDRECNTAI